MEAREQEAKTQVDGNPRPAPRALYEVGGMHLVLAHVVAVGPIVSTFDPVGAMEAGFSQQALMDPPFFYFTVAAAGLKRPSQVWARTLDEAKSARQRLLGDLEDFYMAVGEAVEVSSEQVSVAFFERG